MRTKKASLSLSVNAIVVFVLAFAMLGVGLFFTNMIRDKIGGATEILNPEDLQVKPTSDRPLTVPQQIDLKKKKDLTMKIGYYNRRDTGAEYAKIGISECLDSESMPVTPPVVISTMQTVDASAIGAYNVIIKKADTLGQGIYVCTMVVYDGDQVTGIDSLTEDYMYESQEFFLNVVS